MKRLLEAMQMFTEASVVVPPGESREDGDIGEVSDGSHSFNELYAHRIALFGVLCKQLKGWKSKLHNDGSKMDGWFIAGVQLPTGMITYHIPDAEYAKFPAEEMEKAPEWDGHTAADVVDRLKGSW